MPSQDTAKLDKHCPNQMKFYHYRHITASPTITELSPDCVGFSFKLFSVVDRIKRSISQRYATVASVSDQVDSDSLR